MQRTSWFWNMLEIFRAYTANEEPMIMSEPTKTFRYNHDVAAIHRLRVNIKSLSAEAKIIRQEARRAGPGYREQLVMHRRGRLREEARYTHLALAYLRGRTHKQVEGGCKLPVDVPRLLDKLRRAGTLPEKACAVHTWVGNTSESK